MRTPIMMCTAAGLIMMLAVTGAGAEGFDAGPPDVTPELQEVIDARMSEALAGRDVRVTGAALVKAARRPAARVEIPVPQTMDDCNCTAMRSESRYPSL